MTIFEYLYVVTGLLYNNTAHPFMFEGRHFNPIRKTHI